MLVEMNMKQIEKEIELTKLKINLILFELFQRGSIDRSDLAKWLN